MHRTFVPQSVIPGVRRRVDPETLMAMSDNNGKPLWDMPPPTSYIQHKKRRRHKRTGAVIEDTITVPVYRGTSASYARWVKGQIRRNQRKAAEVQAEVDALNEAEQNSLQEVEAAFIDFVLNSGGYNVEAERF